MPDELRHPVGRAAAERPALLARARAPGVLIAAGIVLAGVLGLVIWLLVRGDGKTNRSRAPATAASIQRLNKFASSVGHPIYWAGSQPSFTYELSQTKDGRVYIRYLPRGVNVGNPNPNYLTIGTYPQSHAFSTLRATARKQGMQTIQLDGGGLAFQYKSRPTSVYLAYPRSDYQIEVFDPSPARALQLVTSGQVKPVGAPATGSKAASVEQLKALASALGHRIYWAGARKSVTYELTRTKDGSVYVRYLPLG